MPWRWAVKIETPATPPDGLPRFFWVGDGPLHDLPNYLNYERVLNGLTSTWRFDFQFQWQDPSGGPVYCGDFSTDLLVRFQWTRQPEAWTGISEILPATITRPDEWEPTFDFENLGTPPWAAGEWVESVRVGGLAWDGGDELAQYRLSHW